MIKINLNNVELTLADAMRKYPELKTYPEFNGEYGISAESVFEMISKTFEDETEFIIERNNREDIYAVDFKIMKKENREIIAYCDLEADISPKSFSENGTFKHWLLTVPMEKKKYFYRNKPFFYVKYSSAMNWCYVIDGWAARDLFKKVPEEKSNRNMKGVMINRDLWGASSSAIFNRKEPYGIHRYPIQEWWKAVGFFLKKRQDKENRGINKWIK